MARVKELLRFLRKHGYEEARQSGSHLILAHQQRRLLSVPVH